MSATPVRGMGHRVKRKEDPRFVRGKGNYVDDVKLPGMLSMAIVRSPYAHARIKSIDASRALAMEGVLAVITGKDLEAAGLAWGMQELPGTWNSAPIGHADAAVCIPEARRATLEPLMRTPGWIR